MKIKLTTKYNFNDTVNEMVGQQPVTGKVKKMAIEIESDSLVNEVYTLDSGHTLKIPRIDFKLRKNQ